MCILFRLQHLLTEILRPFRFYNKDNNQIIDQKIRVSFGIELNNWQTKGRNFDWSYDDM